MGELPSATEDVAVHLLRDLAASTDLPKLVARAQRRAVEAIVISAAAIARWEREDPRGWAAVREWLLSMGVTIVIA